MGAGAGWATQERIAGEPGSRADARAAAAVHREKSNRWQGRHIRQGRQRHTRDEKSHERYIESRHHVLRLRHKGEMVVMFLVTRNVLLHS